MKKLILLLIFLNFGFTLADEISYSINKLLEQENCTLKGDSKRETSSVADIAKWVTEDKSIEDLQDTERILIGRILRSGNMSCFLRINYTSLYARVLFKLEDYENALALYKKASKYRGVDSKYKKHIKNFISRTENKIEIKKIFSSSKLSESSRSEIKPIKESSKTNDFNSLFKNLKKDHEKLIRQIDIADEKINGLESQIQTQSDKLKLQESKIVSLSRLIDSNQDIEEGQRKRNQKETNQFFWILIIGLGLFLVQMILYFKKDDNKLSGQTFKHEEAVDKDLVNAYAKKKNQQ